MKAVAIVLAAALAFLWPMEGRAKSMLTD